MAEEAPGEDGREYGYVRLEKWAWAGMPQTSGSPRSFWVVERHGPADRKCMALAAVRISDFQGCLGSSCILITSPFLTFLSGSHRDLNKCMPDTQLEAPDNEGLCGLGKSTLPSVRQMRIRSSLHLQETGGSG